MRGELIAWAETAAAAAMREQHQTLRQGGDVQDARQRDRIGGNHDFVNVREHASNLTFRPGSTSASGVRAHDLDGTMRARDDGG